VSRRHLLLTLLLLLGELLLEPRLLPILSLCNTSSTFFLRKTSSRCLPWCAPGCLGKVRALGKTPLATGIAFPFSGSPPTTEVLWFRNSAADCSGTACRRSLSTCPRFYVVRPVGASTSRSPFLQEAVCTTRCSSKRLRSVAAADRCRGPC
jgi:hypothetical protein